MRVVSLVPSWTETLLEAGVEVVGRTRFCIHGPGVGDIPRVGGTKDWDLAKIRALKPDWIILDKEENPKFMAEEAEFPYHATEAHALTDMPKCLRDLGGILKNSKLEKMAGEFEALRKPKTAELPGIVEWGRRAEYTESVYLIWKDPWMAAGPGTYIASVLDFCGVKLAPLEGKYPKVDPTAFSPETLLIFSSEPYLFLKKREGLADFGKPFCFVDGESFSWFGIRNLRFLQRLK